MSKIATSRVDEIRKITRMTKILALNAAVEAARSNNPAFAIVADEVGAVSGKVDGAAEALHSELSEKSIQLNELGERLVSNIRGSRLADLALNLIDIIDRNLYERSCDVRWWATDSAMVACAAQKTEEARKFASSRLGVILDSYTVYLDLWVAGADGQVLANGRPRKYAVGTLNVSGEKWFRQGLETRDGSEFVACDIERSAPLGNAAVATYSTAIREGGRTDGKVIGVLGIFFDWEKQSQGVVDSVRLTDEERRSTRAFIVDAGGRVIASTGTTTPGETYRLETKGQAIGSYVDGEKNLIGFALTPGYETYKGLGWYGVLLQKPDHRR